MSTPAHDDQFAIYLAGYHDVVVAEDGTAAAASLPVDTPDELAARLNRGVLCLEVLERFRRVQQVEQATGESPTPAFRSAADRETVVEARFAEVPLTRLGRFRIERELGRGGHGIVFLAIDESLQRPVALKVPRPECLISAEMRRRFLREAHAAARLAHPNLLSVYASGEEGPLCYLASACCSGPTLAAWLRARTDAVPEQLAARLVAELADGVSYAHDRNVLHRDIKPSNVFLDAAPHGFVPVPGKGNRPGPTESPTMCVPKLGDFGLAQLTDDAGEMTRSGAILGTPAYMAPEQARGAHEEIGRTTDVYGLGTVLFELLTGRAPFQGRSDADTLRQVVSDEPPPVARLRRGVSPDLEAICLKCLEKQPSRRYATAAELADDLRRYLSGEPIVARTSNTLERVGKWAKRYPAWAILIAVVWVSFVGGLAFLAYSNARISQALISERESKEALRVQLYAADIRRAGEALALNNVAQAIELLAPYKDSPDGSDLREFAWHYLWSSLGRHRAYLPTHPADVYSIDLSPDRTRLATGCRDGLVRIWRVSDRGLEKQLGCDSEVNEVCFSPDGRWLAAGCDDAHVRVWDTSNWRLRHLLAMGGATVTDVSGKDDALHCLALQADGRVLAGGLCKKCRFAAVRFRMNGTLDASFHDDGIAEPSSSASVYESLVSIQMLPDGKILAVGDMENEGQQDIAMLRYHANGSLDQSFGEHGLLVTDLDHTDEYTSTALLQPDGKLVVGGFMGSSTKDFLLARFQVDGRLDPSFGDGKGWVRTSAGSARNRIAAAALQADGKIVVLGDTADPLGFALFRYDGNGSLEASLVQHGSASISRLTTVRVGGVAVQADGKIVLSGGNGSGSELFVARLTSTGELDPSFGSDGIFLLPEAAESGRSFATGVAIQRDGKIVVPGCVARDGDLDALLLRLDVDGTPDAAFGEAGLRTLSFGRGDDVFTSAVVMPNGQILAGGTAHDKSDEPAGSNFVVARFHADGALDASYTKAGISGLAFSGDSQLLSACANQTVRAWDTSSAKSVRDYVAPSGDIDGVTISHDGQWLAVVAGGSAYAWKTTTEEPCVSISDQVPITSVLFDSPGSLLTVGCENGSIKHCDCATSEWDRELVPPLGRQIKWLKALDQRQLMVAKTDQDDIIHVFDKDYRRITKLKSPAGRIWDIAKPATSPTVVTSDVDGHIIEWDLPTGGQPLHADGSRELVVPGGDFSAFAVSCKGALAACGYHDGRVVVVDAHSGEVRYTGQQHPSAVCDVGFLQQGDELFVAHADGEVYTLNLVTEAVTESRSFAKTLRAVSISPSGEHIALAPEDESLVTLMSWPDGKSVRQISLPGSARWLIFNPTGSALVVLGAAQFTVWATDTARPIASLGKLGQSYEDACFLADGHTLFVAEGVLGVGIYEIPSYRLLARLAGHEKGGVQNLAVTPNGRSVATRGFDGSLSIWDVETRQQLLRLPGNGPATPGSLRFTSDGKLLVNALNEAGSEFLAVWSGGSDRERDKDR
ncbi:MAG: WD40 repeat domain-containing serine/threonine protein kinase [Pirellulales bacterium]